MFLLRRSFRLVRWQQQADVIGTVQFAVQP
nr:MAG TPA: hypothetical protein [Caudoviricetes sp.]